jgi:exopolysaccharide biosynthesis polyprenyl glycosylphosphotransferase
MISLVKYASVAGIILAAWGQHAHAITATFGISGILVAVWLTAVVMERTQSQREQLNRLMDWPKAAPRPIRVLIVGAGQVGRTVAESLEADGKHHVIGFVDDEISTDEVGPWPVLAGRDATADVVSRLAVDEVVLAYAPSWQQRLVEQLAANNPEVGLRVVPSAYESLMHVGTLETRNDIALIRVNNGVDTGREQTKRVFDVMVSGLSLVLLAPVMAAVALLVKLTSPGPIIFAQERVGRFGKRFMVYKFRTMVQDAEARTGPVLSGGDADERLTKIGRILRKLRLDELPQFVNVFRGEMSLVGPRPERPVFVREYEQQTPSYARRHQVRPGITGLAQVCGGYHTDARDKLRFDLIYVAQHSIWLDLSILLRTVVVVVRRSGK